MLKEPERPSSRPEYGDGPKSGARAIVVIAMWIMLIVIVVTLFSSVR